MVGHLEVQVFLGRCQTAVPRRLESLSAYCQRRTDLALSLQSHRQIVDLVVVGDFEFVDIAFRCHELLDEADLLVEQCLDFALEGRNFPLDSQQQLALFLLEGVHVHA